MTPYPVTLINSLVFFSSLFFFRFHKDFFSYVRDCIISEKDKANLFALISFSCLIPLAGTAKYNVE